MLTGDIPKSFNFYFFFSTEACKNECKKRPQCEIWMFHDSECINILEEANLTTEFEKNATSGVERGKYLNIFCI